MCTRASTPLATWWTPILGGSPGCFRAVLGGGAPDDGLPGPQQGTSGPFTLLYRAGHFRLPRRVALRGGGGRGSYLRLCGSASGRLDAALAGRPGRWQASTGRPRWLAVGGGGLGVGACVTGGPRHLSSVGTRQLACSSTTPIAARVQQSAPVSSVDSVLRPPHLTPGECALGWWVSPIFSLVLLRAVSDWSPCHHTVRWSLQATRLRGCRTDLVGIGWCTRATHEWAHSRQIDVCVWSACTSVAGSGSALATCNPCVRACVRACGCLAVGTR